MRLIPRTPTPTTPNYPLFPSCSWKNHHLSPKTSNESQHEGSDRTPLRFLSFFFHFDRDTQGLTSHITCPPTSQNSLHSHLSRATRVRKFRASTSWRVSDGSCRPPGVLSEQLAPEETSPPVCKSQDHCATIRKRIRVEGRSGSVHLSRISAGARVLEQPCR